MQIINREDEDKFCKKALSETEKEITQRTVHDDNYDYDDDDDDDSASSYFLYGETKTKSKKLVELGQKINNNGSTIEAPQEGQGRRCSYCGQEFKSGKALGGHIRIHKRAIQPADTKTSAAATDFSTVTDNDQKQNVHVCFICKDSFPSIMALCGHMRYHPERDWKGIRPPKETIEPQAEPKPGLNDQAERHEPAEPVLNLLDFTPNWSTTGKRGRKATISAEMLRMINQVPEKKRKIIQDAEGGNYQACKLPAELELKTEINKLATTVELEEGEILEKDLPEERGIIEEELDTISKVDNSSDTIISDDAPPIDNKKKREANNPGSIVTKSKETARQHYGDISNHKSFVRMAEENIDLKVATAGKNGRIFDLDHKASLSLKANPAGTVKMFNLDLNLPYEE